VTEHAAVEALCLQEDRAYNRTVAISAFAESVVGRQSEIVAVCAWRWCGRLAATAAALASIDIVAAGVARHIY